MNLYLWKESEWENANKESIESYNRGKEKVCAKEGKDVFVVKRRKKRDA